MLTSGAVGTGERLSYHNLEEGKMETITRAEMETEIASDLAYLLERGSTGTGVAAVLARTTPDTIVHKWGLGGGDAVYEIPDAKHAYAVFGKTEPTSLAWPEWEPGVSLYEDNAGGLWLVGRTAEDEYIHYGDMAFSEGGVTALVSAYHEGIASWGHQDNDYPVTTLLDGMTCIAEYDGATLTVHVDRMGAAGREFCLGHETAAQVS